MTGPPVSLEGRTLRMARTRTAVSVGPRLGEGGQGVVHEAAFGGFGCAVNDANRPPPGDPMRTWWPIYPGFFRRVFEQAFTAGLRDTSGTARVSEGVWRRALLRLGDCVAACSCRASVFYDPGQPSAPCWNCGHIPPRPLLLELPGGSVVLCDGGVITAHHLRRDRDYDTVVATVEAHPASPGQMILRNAGTQPWTMRPAGEGAKTVEPGRRLAARAMTIDFGPARGRIPGSQTAGTPRGGAPAGEGER